MTSEMKDARPIGTARPTGGNWTRAEAATPLDLRRGFPEGALLRLAILAAAGRTAPAPPTKEAYQSPPLPASNFASLLAFAYATGRFASEDIAAECREVPAMRYLVMGRPVVWTDLRRFRRQNRALVTACLAELLRLVRDHSRATDPAIAREVAIFHDPEKTAESLVQQAILADSATADV